MRKVLVVGGGVAGCATALALHQHGIPAVVYEARYGARLPPRQPPESPGFLRGGIRISVHPRSMLDGLT
ncbi:FAD-dependent oxidoreductase [Actinopolymorpha sp. NPDC004070]|uniref:FAD-dependent oxidoreductase n=1 Tax=Actinopolymorpha sp. NPDC004070 TaxID=3154548 RepID=UPI0033B3F9C2